MVGLNISYLEKSLGKLYSKHHTVKWYDAEQAFKEEVNMLKLEDVSIIKISNDELAVKYRILKQEPRQKILFYIFYSKPAHEDN